MEGVRKKHLRKVASVVSLQSFLVRHLFMRSRRREQHLSSPPEETAAGTVLRLLLQPVPDDCWVGGKLGHSSEERAVQVNWIALKGILSRKEKFLLCYIDT